MEEKVKKGTGKTVTIVILILIILGLIAYIGYFQVYAPSLEKNSHVVEDEEEDDVREMYVSEGVKISKKLNDYLYFAEEFSKENVKDFDNQTLLMFAIAHIENNKSGYSKGEVEQIIDDYFSEMVEITHEDILCPQDKTILYKYTEGEGYKLSDDHMPHGGISTYQGEAHIVDGTVEKDKYILKTRILYQYNENSLDAFYYKSVEDVKANKNIINKNLSDDDYYDVESFLPITTFTFTKKGNNYFLESIKVD